MYRPQFAYPTPPGYQDRPFIHSFDGTTVKLLSGNIANGVFLQNIMLPLDTDEMFLWRGWKVQSYSINFLSLYFQWKDPFGNYLSPTQVTADHIGVPSGTAGFGFATVPIEPEIICPAGAMLSCYIFNPSVQVALPRVVMFGVKRSLEEKPA